MAGQWQYNGFHNSYQVLVEQAIGRQRISNAVEQFYKYATKIRLKNEMTAAIKSQQKQTYYEELFEYYFHLLNQRDRKTKIAKITMNATIKSQLLNARTLSHNCVHVS